MEADVMEAVRAELMEAVSTGMAVGFTVVSGGAV